MEKRGITDMQESSTIEPSDKQGTQMSDANARKPLRVLCENLLLLFDGFRFLSLLWQESR